MFCPRHHGIEHYQPYKLIGPIPEAIKKYLDGDKYGEY